MPSAGYHTVIDQVVHTQLAAFKTHDQAKSFSQNSSGFQAHYVTASNSMRLTVKGYFAVHQLQEIHFLAVRESESTTGEQDYLKGLEGKLLIAERLLVRLEGGTLRLGGCSDH